AIAAAAAAIGAALGIVAWGLVALRDRASRRAPRSAGSLAAASLACVAALHALAMLWAMAARPQLYAADWYARVAPNLVQLADRGARFDRAYVSLPRTFPSWVTLLTGKFPHHHGIRSMFPRWE